MLKPGGHWESTLVGGRDGVRGGSIPFFSNGGATPPSPYTRRVAQVEAARTTGTQSGFKPQPALLGV